jgi:3'(2'), 5'-bisphosphate nucleotidase
MSAGILPALKTAGFQPANEIMEKELVELALKAGDAIRGVYERGNWEQTEKEDRSPLTEADRASHAILCEGLVKIEPGIPILSEESEKVSWDIRKTWDDYFLVDPLDGTREFVRKIPEFAINIAWIQNGRAILGLIHSPLTQITYFARTGEGIFRWDHNHRERITVENSTGLRVLLSHTDRTPDLDVLIRKLPDSSVLRMGSSLKFSEVAQGKADFYPRLKPSMEWDTASGTVLVEESGGLMCDLNGNRIEYNRQDMLNPPFYVMGKNFFNKFPDWKRNLIKEES